MGLRNKSDELKYSFEIDGINPHILCLSGLSEQNVAEQDLLHLTVGG
jgi:hypothetical protein